ncbi:MAG: hypothetical protein IJR87_13615 [Bacteroidaceae bacterium]|nr:hypothetical protein [Bacteroidaceae bacterium]
MKKNIMYMAALAMLTAACSNEDDTILPGGENNGAGDVKMITETVMATDGDGSGATRAAVDASAAFTWSAGDEIAVHVSDGAYYTTTALAAGGSNTAEFTVTYPDGQSRDAFAIFPAAVDLFCWSTAATYYGIYNTMEASDYSGDFKDWSENISNSWRTMTDSEWVYLTASRTNGGTVNGDDNARYTLATINTDGTGVNGVIIFPDDVTFAADEATWGSLHINSNWETKCTTAQWTALAAKGCVFLPAAGMGVAKYSVVDKPGTTGFYWSSVSSGDNVSRFCFSSSAVTYSYDPRYFGYSVRLVRNL